LGTNEVTSNAFLISKPDPEQKLMPKPDPNPDPEKIIIIISDPQHCTALHNAFET
jgi:hypothetical protein